MRLIQHNAMIPGMFKRSIIFLLLIAFIAALGKSWHWAKDGFSIRRVAVSLPEELDPLPLDSESEEALTQNYRYLGHGHQNYAFVSEDGHYVLKLPRYDWYREPFWLRSCRFHFLDSYREALATYKKQRLQRLNQSYQIAFQDMKEETSLLFIHLSRTNHLHKKIRIKDCFGRAYLLDLDRSGFLLQRYHELMMPAFTRALQSGKREQAKAILQAFLELNEVRARKGIYYKDPSFLRNFGLEGSRGIQIDVGSLYRPAQGTFSGSFLKTAGHVKDWLAQNDPEIERWFDVQTNEILRQESQ